MLKCIHRYSLPSQQHMYMETQCAVADPEEDGGMVIHSSTQTLDGVQSAVARALGIPCHAVTASEAPASRAASFILCSSLLLDLLFLGTFRICRGASLLSRQLDSHWQQLTMLAQALMLVCSSRE